MAKQRIAEKGSATDYSKGQVAEIVKTGITVFFAIVLVVASFLSLMGAVVFAFMKPEASLVFLSVFLFTVRTVSRILLEVLAGKPAIKG